MAKVIFNYRDFVAGTKNGEFRYSKISRKFNFFLPESISVYLCMVRAAF
jgi:hypothetical protein